MLLADAIEAWGQQHREALSSDEINQLGRIWSAVRNSDAGQFDLDTMTKDDARAVMALFGKDERPAVSDTLNKVRAWTLENRDDSPPTPVPPTTGPPPGDIPAPEPPAAPPEPPAAPIVQIGGGAPLGQSGDPLMSSPPPAPVPPGPPQPPAGTAGAFGAQTGAPGVAPQMTPPPGVASDSSGDKRGLLVALAIIIALALIVYFAFVRDGDDDGTTTSVGGVPAASDGSDDNTQPSGDDQSGTDFSGLGSGDFCSVARQLEEEDPFGDSVAFDQAFFDRTIALFSDIRGVAPPELAGDIDALLTTFSQFRDIGAKYNFNLGDPNLATEFAAVDTTAMDTASANIERYLQDVCGIDISGTDPGTDPGDSSVPAPGFDAGLDDLTDDELEALGNSILAGLGISPELAQCLEAELGDITSATADPSLLTKPVCGTTLADVLAGLGG